ncbi:MAG TPA: efflux RND transporter periplasmic adaptor subunit [Burkholderiales bacterium]|nr:efflux RND transporter periplasmic adaptor subunit [Burkholderiales bacterium]
MHTPTIRNVTILTALVTAALIAGCGSKSDATAAAPKADAPKPDAAKEADASKAATPPPAAAAKPGLPVKAEPVKIEKVSDDVSAVGSLLAEESVIIRPEIDGRIVGLHFQEGQAVSAGTRLVTIDSTEYEAQTAAQRADLKTEEQRLARTKDLYEQKFISKDALDVQVGNVARLKAHVDEAESRVAKTVIRAPFSGILGLRQVSPGAYVKAGNDIVRLENVSSIKVDFRIPENYLSKIRPNQEIAVKLDAYPGEEFRGRVYAVEPVVDERTRTIAMRARIPNKGFKLKPGMFVRVLVTLDSRANAVVIPEQAIWPQGKDSFVFRVVDGKAALTKVDIGNRAPGTVEILKGLAANDMVITDGQMKLKDGAPVTVIGAPPAAPAAPTAPAAKS